MRNVCLTIAYDGADFHGWQRQPGKPTVQECLEAAIQGIVGHVVKLYGSGRTDAGVHALNQAANFKTTSPIPCANVVKALNDLLPSTVRVKEARDVPLAFHARYDILSKTYRYRILQAAICSPFLARFVWHYPYPLDRSRMARAARLIKGRHDFTSFAAAQGREEGDSSDSREQASQALRRDVSPESDVCASQADNDAPRPTSAFPPSSPDRHSMVRTIFSSRFFWRPRSCILIYEVRGDGFLHHMVRNIVGTLVEVGRGKLVPEDIPRILGARDRTLAGPTAPASGLCLFKVEYGTTGASSDLRKE